MKAVRQSPVDPVQTVAPVRDASYLAERRVPSIYRSSENALEMQDWLP